MASRVATAVGVLLVLGLGQQLTARAPSPTEASAPYERPGQVGTPVALRAADVVVTAVDGATAVTRSGGRGLKTPGVVVIVSYRVTTRAEPGVISGAALVSTDGQVYAAAPGAARSSTECRVGQPGITVACSAVIELPRDAAVGATLRLSRGADDVRFDDVAVIDLGITQEAVAGWTARTTPVAVPAASIVGAS